MNRITLTAATLATAAIGTLAPLALAGPAHADTSFQGCTVGPKRPVATGTFNGSNVPYVRYSVSVECQRGLEVELEQNRWEQDLEIREGNADDEFTGSSSRTIDFSTGSLSRTWNVVALLPNTGAVEDGSEEVYQAVRFRVTSGVVTGPWTDLELTQPRTIFR